MRITLKPVQHDAVKVTSPRGTEVDPADMLRHIRRVEAEERAKGHGLEQSTRKNERTDAVITTSCIKGSSAVSG